MGKIGGRPYVRVWLAIGCGADRRRGGHLSDPLGKYLAGTADDRRRELSCKSMCLRQRTPRESNGMLGHLGLCILASAYVIEEFEYTRDVAWPPVESNHSTRLGPQRPRRSRTPQREHMGDGARGHQNVRQPHAAQRSISQLPGR